MVACKLAAQCWGYRVILHARSPKQVYASVNVHFCAEMNARQPRILNRLKRLYFPVPVWAAY
jgi:hypothetical protein